jgi:hypothetical protein
MKKDKTFTLYALLKQTFVYVMDLLFKIECLPDYDALLLANYIETFGRQCCLYLQDNPSRVTPRGLN